MKKTTRPASALLASALLLSRAGLVRGAEAPAGFIPLFDGTTLAGWRVPEGDNGHWKVVAGVIDYDARSEAVLRGGPAKRKLLVQGQRRARDPERSAGGRTVTSSVSTPTQTRTSSCWGTTDGSLAGVPTWRRSASDPL